MRVAPCHSGTPRCGLLGLSHNRLKRLSSVSTQAIREKVGSLGSSFGTLFGDQSAPENLGDMGSTIQRLAENYAGLGLGADKAVQRAVERVQQTHVNVNGRWIDASDRRIPPDLPGDVLRAYADKHGKAEGLSAGEGAEGGGTASKQPGLNANLWRA